MAASSSWRQPVVPVAPVAPPTGWLARARAAGLHLLASAAIVAALCAVVFGAWYPGPLPAMMGVGAILAIVVGVDLVVGPLLTFVVFDRRKRRLGWDLAAIAALQLAALGYGVHTLHQGRPAFVVLVKDRFEVVAPADLRRGDRQAAVDNPHARTDPLRPRWVGATVPARREDADRILFEALTSGTDLQHHPRLYVDYAAESATALSRALPVSRLRALNPGGGADIDALVARSGLPEDRLAYLPLRGPARDGAVLLDRRDARVVGMGLLQPW